MSPWTRSPPPRWRPGGARDGRRSSCCRRDRADGLMAVLAFANAKGAPGVTTSVLALAFAWHRPALVVEADMAGSSSILSGFLRGSTDHSHGLVGLSIAARQHGFTDRVLWEQCLQLGEERYLLPGIADPVQEAAL